MKRTPPKPGKPPERKTRIKAVNRERRKARFDAAYGKDGDYGAWIRSLPCLLAHTGRCEGPVVCAHAVKTRGAGGQATDSVPLCQLHETRWHQGRLTFWDLTGIDMASVAARLAREWEEREAA